MLFIDTAEARRRGRPTWHEQQRHVGHFAPSGTVAFAILAAVFLALLIALPRSNGERWDRCVSALDEPSHPPGRIECDCLSPVRTRGASGAGQEVRPQDTYHRGWHATV
jgi:hypothetical protein